MNQTCQPKIFKTWRLWIFLFKNLEILKSRKINWTLGYSSTYSISVFVNRYGFRHFWFIWYLIPLYILSTQKKIILCGFGDYVDFMSFKDWCWVATNMNVCSYSISITSPLVKIVNPDVLDHHFFIDGDKTGFSNVGSTASNETYPHF